MVLEKSVSKESTEANADPHLMASLCDTASSSDLYSEESDGEDTAVARVATEDGLSVACSAPTASAPALRRPNQISNEVGYAALALHDGIAQAVNAAITRIQTEEERSRQELENERDIRFWQKVSSIFLCCCEYLSDLSVSRSAAPAARGLCIVTRIKIQMRMTTISARRLRMSVASVSSLMRRKVTRDLTPLVTRWTTSQLREAQPLLATPWTSQRAV